MSSPRVKLPLTRLPNSLYWPYLSAMHLALTPNFCSSTAFHQALVWPTASYLGVKGGGVMMVVVVVWWWW